MDATRIRTSPVKRLRSARISVSQSSAASSTDEIQKFLTTAASSFAVPGVLNIESAKAKVVRSPLKPKPLRKPRKAPSAVCDGNILPENFRKPSIRGSKKMEPVTSAPRVLKPRSQQKSSETTARDEISVPAENLEPTLEPKKERKPRNSAVKSAKKLKTLGLFSGDAYGAPSKPAENLEPIFEQKKQRRARSAAAKSVVKKLPTNFSADPLKSFQTDPTSQKSRICRKPKSASEQPAEMGKFKMADRKQPKVADEMELCSLLSSCTISSSEDQKPSAGLKYELFAPRPSTKVGTRAFLRLSLPDMLSNEADSASADDLAEFSEIFSTTLNVGNFSENLNIMSVIRRATRIQRKLPHFVPPSENWFENFEIW